MSRGLRIASQLDADTNAALGAHPSRPEVFTAPDDAPWAAAADADVLLARPTPSWSRACALPRPAGWPGRLRWIHSASVGVDFYPPWLLQGPAVSCGRGVASDQIAEYVLAAIFHQAKDLDAVRAHGPDDWRQRSLGTVTGTTLGIVGLGAIGGETARRALAIGMTVVALRRRALPSPIPGVAMVATLPDLMRRADHILLSLPATPDTAGLIDADALAAAQPHAHVINVARGAVLDHAALLHALDTNRLGFATLDVTDPEPLPPGHPLWRHPRVRLTPHIAANYARVRHRLVPAILAHLDDLAAGRSPGDLVDPVHGY